MLARGGEAGSNMGDQTPPSAPEACEPEDCGLDAPLRLNQMDSLNNAGWVPRGSSTIRAGCPVAAQQFGLGVPQRLKNSGWVSHSGSTMRAGCTRT